MGMDDDGTVKSLKNKLLCGCMPEIGEGVKKFLQTNYGGLLGGVLSTVIAIFLLIYLYSEDNSMTYSGDGSFGINALGARNSIFAASIILGVTALGAVVARFAGSVGAKFYKSALTVYQENYLHTTTSVLVVSVFFLIATTSTEHDHYPLLIISIICAFVLKALMEIRHSDFIMSQQYTTTLDGKVEPNKDIFKIQFRGGALVALLLLLYTLIKFAGQQDYSDLNSEAGSAWSVIITIFATGVCLVLQPEGGIMGSGLSLSQVALGFGLAFGGWFLAKQHDSAALVVVLGLLYLDGLQLGKLHKGEKVIDKSDSQLLTGLFLAVQVFLGVLGLIGLNVSDMKTTEFVKGLNETQKLDPDNAGSLEGLTSVLYGVAVAASLIKIVSPFVGVSNDDASAGFLEIRSPSPRQTFRKFSSTGLLLASSILWIGGADYTLPENAKISTGFATALFTLALVNRLLESFIDSTVDDSKFNSGFGTAIWDYFIWWKKDPEDEEESLNKTTYDNVRVWMVIGALATSFGLLVRYGEQSESSVWEGDASTKQGYFQAAFWLVLFHLIFALLNVIGDFFAPAKIVAVSRSSAARFIVSTTAICALVITTAETGHLVKPDASVTAPDSAENNIIGALVAYLIADAVGAEFL